MSSILPETALILIAILPSQRDFDIARLFGWYRIPLKSAPKVISVDYLAFYQPRSLARRSAGKLPMSPAFLATSLPGGVT